MCNCRSTSYRLYWCVKVLRSILNKIGACAPKLATCNLQLVSTLFVSTTKERGCGATHHPACVTLRRCPPPYLPLANRDDKLRTQQQINTIGTQCPETCHLPLATSNLQLIKKPPYNVRWLFYQSILLRNDFNLSHLGLPKISSGVPSS